MEATIALAGNPNSGKTTMFNALTGSRQHVGNYPGVTVEKKQGVYKNNGYQFKVVDLPGTYSLSAYSLEEVVAREFLVNEQLDLVIPIVDASNLERNLYLIIQLLEMGLPICIALNMMDVAQKRGIKIDPDKLAEHMQVPVIPTIARNGQGKHELMETAAALIKNKKPESILSITYGKDIDPVLDQLQQTIEQEHFLTDTYPGRWIALKLIEKDDKILEAGRNAAPRLAAELEGVVDKLSNHLQHTTGNYPEAIITDYRYGFIKSILKQGVVSYEQDMNRYFVSDKIDQVVTHRFIGPLIMAAVIWGLYHFTFTYSELPVGWFESLFGWLSSLVETILPNGLIKSLIISGIIDGVGGVLGFTPLIMFMFFGIAILEDSGYLARMAYMLDRIFRLFGLHGSSVVPFIVSGGIAGGCAVPGVLASRTLKSPKERLATLLTVPFMNCGAKLPVFALIVAAFFATNKAMIMMYITIISWVGALLVAKLLRMTVVKGESTPFVMELPPYRLPTLKGILIHTWERTWQYVKKAGTVILGISVLLWAMMTFPGLPDSETSRFAEQRAKLQADTSAAVHELKNAEAGNKLTDATLAFKEKINMLKKTEASALLRHSFAGRIGIALESISQFAGFDWRTNIALVGGFAAKEIVVSTLGTAYSLGKTDMKDTSSLASKLVSSPGWGPLTGASLIIFIMFYSPCFVSVVCISREAGSWKWGVFSMVFNTILAFILAVIVFQVGTAMGF